MYKLKTVLVDQGFTAGEMSGVLGVGKRTVQRRLAAFGLSKSHNTVYKLSHRSPGVPCDVGSQAIV